MSNGGVPCFRCAGKGAEPTALEIFDELEYTLRALNWPDERISRLKNEVCVNEVLAGMPRWGGIELRSPDGTIRTLERFK
jgi:hypothetical protein